MSGRHLAAVEQLPAAKAGTHGTGNEDGTHQPAENRPPAELDAEELDAEELDARLDDTVAVLLRDARTAGRLGRTKKMHALCNAVLALDPEQPAAKEMLRGFAVRRQMTLLFCDLVGSTEMADSRDPEEVTALLGHYRSTCLRVINRFDGWVDDHRGDGMLVLFGYPEVRETDAQRAVLCGLQILAELTGSGAEPGPFVDQQVRISVHTDLVVVDDIGISGSTSNEAARLQEKAAANTVLISDTTYDLVKPYFSVSSIGPVQLRGVSRRLEAFRVLGPAAAPRSITGSPKSTCFVGRTAEVDQIAARWRQTVQDGIEGSPGSTDHRPTALLVTGAPGMGKTRLVSQAAVELDIPNVHCACSQLHQNTSLHAFRQLLEEACGITESDSGQERLDLLRARLPAETTPTGDLPFLAGAFDIALNLLRPPVDVDASVLRQHGLAAAAALLLSVLPPGPAMLFVDDLHWADQSTLDLLEVLLSSPRPDLMVVLAARDSFQPRWSTTTLHRLPLEPLDAGAVAELTRLLPEGSSLSVAQRDELMRRSDGVPLFVEELVRTATLVDTGQAASRSVRFSSHQIPPALRDPLLARLALPQVDLDLAQAAAALGRDFDRSLLAHLVGGDSVAFRSRLDTLFDAGLLEHVGDRIRFRHELIREIAYETQSRSSLVSRHGAIADQLAVSAAMDSLRSAAELAFHLEHALRYPEAVQAHLRVAAGDQAVGSHVQACLRLTNVLALVDKLPSGDEQLQTELAVRQLRSFSAVMVHGYAAPEAAEDYPRCVEICSQSHAATEVVSSLIRTWSYYAFCGNLDAADSVLAVTVDQVATAGLSFPAEELGQGVVGFFRGRYDTAARQLEQCAAHPSVATSSRRPPDIWPLPNDPLAAVQAHLAATRWVTGQPEQSARWAALALERSDALEFPYGPFSRCYVGCLLALVSNLAGDPVASAARGAEVAELGERHGFPMWQVAGGIVGLVARVHGGDLALLPALIAQVDFWRTNLAADVWTPYWLTEIARGQSRLGQVPEALRTFDEALSVSTRTGSAFYDAETMRERGSLRLSTGDPDGLRELRAAAELAERQGARVFVARASRSLAAAARVTSWPTPARREPQVRR